MRYLPPGMVVSAAIAALALAGCGSKNKFVAPPPAKVVVAKPLQQSVTLYIYLTGNTAPYRTANLVARVQGYLESIDYKDGGAVTKGTQLFGIERDTYQAQVGQAKAQLAHDQAVVGEAQVDLGNLVGASGPTTLATIVQTDPLYVNFTLSEPQFLTIRRSNARAGLPVSTADLTYLASIPVEIGLQDEEGYPHKGHLDYVSPQVDPSTGTIAVRAIFDNKENALLPGLFVRVRGPIGHQDRALLTRNDAIGTSQEGSYVLVVGADNVAQRKTVKTGQRQGQLVIIESGLDPGDWVVIEGIQQAFPGAKVEPQRSELNSSEASSEDAKTSSPNPPPK